MGSASFEGTLTGEELAKWRSNKQLVSPWRIETRGNPLEGADRIVNETAEVPLAPLEPGIMDARAAVDKFLGMILRWCKENPQFLLERARILKATSPLQFSHMTDEQLAGSLLTEIATRKAQEGVERVYKQRGWARAPYADAVANQAPRPAGAVLLPGQQGRDG